MLRGLQTRQRGGRPLSGPPPLHTDARCEMLRRPAPAVQSWRAPSLSRCVSGGPRRERCEMLQWLLHCSTLCAALLPAIARVCRLGRPVPLSPLSPLLPLPRYAAKYVLRSVLQPPPVPLPVCQALSYPDISAATRCGAGHSQTPPDTPTALCLVDQPLVLLDALPTCARRPASARNSHLVAPCPPARRPTLPQLPSLRTRHVPPAHSPDRCPPPRSPNACVTGTRCHCTVPRAPDPAPCRSCLARRASSRATTRCPRPRATSPRRMARPAPRSPRSMGPLAKKTALAQVRSRSRSRSPSRSRSRAPQPRAGA